MDTTAVLLINLGSPASTAIPDVRRYLREFLMDERVIDLPYWQRWLLVNGCILRFRPAKTAEAYQKVWTSDGAPLMVISRQLQQKLQAKIPVPVELAMRYQEPSIPATLEKMLRQGVRKIVLAPLYPHYAMSSYETVVVRVRDALKQLGQAVDLRILAPFYAHPAYIKALATSATAALTGGFDHLLFSFHGLPERHLRLSDPTGHHCLATPDCCQVDSPALPTCYRAQAFRTVAEFVKLTGVPPSQYSISFQSRLGRDPWLKPYTDFELIRLAQH
jgi:ferrochelatase